MKHYMALGLLIPLVTVLAGCGGGGGDDDDDNGGVQPQTYTISGTVRAASNIVLDTDTNDPDSVYLANDTPVTAQAIPNPAMVGGFVTERPTFSLSDRFTLLADPDDVYVVDLVAGQSVAMEVANPAPADLDLGLYDSNLALVDASLGVARFESVTAPASGRYYVRVNAYSDKSNYVLSVGTGANVASTLSLSTDFVPDEAVVTARPLAGDVTAKMMAQGHALRAGAADRPMLVGLGGLRTALSAEDPLPPRLTGTTMTPEQAAKLRTLYQIKALRSQADVASADPNYRYQPQKVPNDPFYAFQWHYPLINLPQAWDVTTGTPASGEVVVAVVDTGVFLGHQDLAANLYRRGDGSVVGYDFIRSASSSNDGDGIDADANDPGDQSTPASSSWHGTHVAGTIAASSNNGTGVSGVAWGAKIMPVRVIGKGGGSSYDVIQGVRYAAGLSNDSGTLPPRRADVINLSLGCQNCFSASEQALYNQVRAAGSVVVAAAGNENSGVAGYPASYSGVISVSAVAMDRSRAPYSNFGPHVDVAAPGGDTSRDRNGDGYADGVLSTLVGANLVSDYRFYQGTSMAAPHVAGVVALMKAVHPALTPADFDALLASGSLTTDLGANGRDDTYGWGMIDAAKAVLAAQNAASGTQVATLAANPSRLDFGASLNALDLTLTQLGSGGLGVSAISADAAWLGVSASSVGNDGLGGYTVQVNRGSLPPGSYSAQIMVTATDGARIQVPVSMQVMSTALAVNTGRYWLLVQDENANLVAQFSTNGSGGRYDYEFSGLPAGRYFVYAGTDSDWDDFICDDGEACGAYPTLGTPDVVQVDGNRSGLDFTVGFVGSPGVQQALGTQGAGYARNPVKREKGVQ